MFELHSIYHTVYLRKRQQEKQCNTLKLKVQNLLGGIFIASLSLFNISPRKPHEMSNFDIRYDNLLLLLKIAKQDSNKFIQNGSH